jgi:hypothetical protein
MVHSTAAGCAPPEDAREMVKLTVPPGTELAELNETAACCATAEPTTTERKSTAFDARLPALTRPRDFNAHLQNLNDLL